jgi:hypothetical protein
MDRNRRAANEKSAVGLSQPAESGPKAGQKIYRRRLQT